MAVVTAQGLGLRTRRGWVFRDVDLTVEPGELVALTGPAGSGRTSLLLALAGHFRTNAGTVTRQGRAGVGLVPGLNEPERGLTAAEHARERLLLLGLPNRPVDLPVPVTALGRDLSPYQRQRLMLRLAEIGTPSLIVADDVDAGLSSDERAWLWSALEDLAERGYAVVVTCREPISRATCVGLPGRPQRLDRRSARDRTEYVMDDAIPIAEEPDAMEKDA
jgi:ABC-2 type transport system ATP-binding protein